jgi:hypothetical protein
VVSTRTQITSHLLNLGLRSLPDFTVLEHTALEAAAGKAFERLEPGVAGKVSWLVTRAGRDALGRLACESRSRSAGSTGHACLSWLRDGFLNRVRSIPFRMLASPPLIRDKNRMR